MKTSNKILLGLLIGIFAVPFVLSAMLKYKVRNNEFTVVKRDEDDERAHARKGSFTAFKVLKVTAPAPDFLSCFIRQSNTSSFSYFTYGNKDSVAVETVGDTLNVRFISLEKGGKNQRYGNNLRLNISMPSLSNAFIDGAVVVLDSMPAARELKITLVNRGMISNQTPGEARRLRGDSATNNSTSKLSNENDDPVAIADAILTSQAFDGLENSRLSVSMPDFKELFIFHLL